MNLSKGETWLVAILSAITCMALLVAIFMLSAAPKDHTELLKAVIDNGQRLESLEKMKTPATKRRFTGDDFIYLTKCLEIPYSQRQPCINELIRRVNERP